MKNAPSLRRLSRRRLAAAAASSGVVVAIAVAGCSGGSDNDSAGSTSSETFAAGGGAGKDAVRALDAPAPAAADQAAQVPSSAQQQQPIILTRQALIKTGEIELQSAEIQRVVDRIDGYVLTSGGRIDSEDVSTDSEGTINHARLEAKVPVARFDGAFNQISSFADLVRRHSSTQDVTARVADVNSRVASAKQSIAQLRRLFDRAASLGQVIRLERELAQREADLEALQAQQRSLTAQTTMSTILITISLPPKTTPAPSSDDDQAGFVSGIKTGWDALVTFVVGSSHFIGLVLPLGALAAVVGILAWPLARRFNSRRAGQPQPSE